MNFDEAKSLLDACERRELRDHSLGDMELSWKKEGRLAATGYSGGRTSIIWMADGTRFKGYEAGTLVSCGKLVEITREDTDNPAEFKHNIFENNRLIQ